MMKISEVLTYMLLTITCFVSTLVIVFKTEYSILVFIPIIIYAIVVVIMIKNKRIIEYVKDDFKKLGYELISERPLKSSESKIEIVPTILLNTTPIKKHKNKYSRIFTAKNRKGKLVELNTIVTERYNGIIEIEIKNKKTISI